MDRGEQHVAALVEDVLGAVAVVVVDIEDGDFLAALVEEGLCGDGGIVQVAVAAHQVAGGMMAWRTTQGEGAVGAVGNLLLGAERDLGSAVGGLPGAGSDRRAAIETVVAELAVQVIGDHPAQGARRPGERQQIALAALLLPARPGALEEFQVGLAVDALDGRQAEILGRADFAELASLDARKDVVGALRLLEAGHQLPVDQLAFAVMQVVVVAVVGEHAKRSRLVVVPALFARWQRIENAGNGQKGIEMAKKWPRAIF